jgi:hypothetical protein
VTHRDARGLALDGEIELAAAAGGAADGHGMASGLSMRRALERKLGRRVP